MLAEQISVWEQCPPELRIILVDDGSPEPAEDVIRGASESLLSRLELYRIDVDIPWNREGARNLSAKQAETDWLLMADLDHVLPPDSARRLLEFSPDPESWYRFRRFRVGKADDTRKKDAIPDDVEFGEIKMHVDSFLMTREMYWDERYPGYDEDYAGTLGGGNPFLKAHERIAPVEMLPDDICLHVYTRSMVPDSSDYSLSRDRTRYSQIRRHKEHMGDTVPRDPILFPWHRVELV